MSNNISGFGLRITLTASVSFPRGFTISAFAGDADPFDNPTLTIAEHEMGLNGDLITWSNANPLAVTFNIIPNSEDDINLNALFEANRVGRGKQSVQDEITVVAIYPDGNTATYSGGSPTSFIPANSVASAGRLKTKPYTFNFENVT